jgi:hypothetical protein
MNLGVPVFNYAVSEDRRQSKSRTEDELLQNGSKFR